MEKLNLLDKDVLNNVDNALSIIHMKFGLITPVILSVNLKFVEGNDIYTDGNAIYLGVDYLKGKSLSNIVFYLLHEAFHLVFCHTYFYNSSLYEKSLREIAYEYIVNMESLYYMNKFIDNKFYVTSYCYICDRYMKFNRKKLDYDGKVPPDGEKEIIVSCYYCVSMDDDYISILEKLKDRFGSDSVSSKVVGGNKSLIGGGFSLCNDFRVSDNDSDEVIKKVSESMNSNDVKENIDRYGNMSSNFLREFELLNSKKVNWRTALRKAIFGESFGFKDISMYKYNFSHHLFINNKILVNKIVGKKPIRVVVAVDTSGSISDEIYNEFITEVYNLISSFSMDVSFISCDCEIKGVVNRLGLGNFKLVENISYGGGGTSFVPVFEYIKEKMKNKVNALVYLTDGYGVYPNYSPEYNVVWVIYKGLNSGYNKPPFGNVIYI